MLNASVECDDDDDGLSTSAVIGITFVITLIFSILLTLLIVFIVYKIIKTKQSTTKNEASPTGSILSDALLPKDFSNKGRSSDENYESPAVNINSAKDTAMYQKNPSEDSEKFDGDDDTHK